MILEKTVELIYQIYRSYKILKPKINQIIFGLKYIAVELHAYSYSPFLGLSYVPHNILKSTEYSNIGFDEKLKENRISEILKWSYEPPSIKKIVGIATLNAMSQHILEIKNPFKSIKKSLIDHLKIETNTNVVFVGADLPLIHRINEITKNITLVSGKMVSKSLFNQISIKKCVDDLSAEEKAADILFITDTILVNDILEELLIKFKKKARKIVLIGPSASMIPDILFDYGIDIVVGTKVINYESTLDVIKERRDLKNLMEYTQNYCLIKD